MPHIHEKIDFAVEAFIVHDGKVLLRMHNKYGLWLPPGGHIELDEDPAEAVVREAKEEVGLDIVLRGETFRSSDSDPRRKSLIPPRFMGRHWIDDKHEHVCMYYFATSETDQVVPSGDDRSDEWHWFTEEELKDPKYGVKEDIRFYATRALKAAIIEKW